MAFQDEVFLPSCARFCMTCIVKIVHNSLRILCRGYDVRVIMVKGNREL